MTSQPIRDQVEDHLITPKNAALLIIDYQPPQVSSIVSMDHRTLVSNIVAVARLAKLYALPIVLSTVNVKTGLSAPTIHQLAEVLAGIEEIDRTTRSSPSRGWRPMASTCIPSSSRSSTMTPSNAATVPRDRFARRLACCARPRLAGPAR